MRLSLKARRGLLVLHLLFAGILLGNMIVFLIFSIMIAASDGSLAVTCYRGMHILANTSLRASTIGTAVTGVLLSVWTKWGLFQFYWLIAKEGLTLLAAGINLWGMYVWTLDALAMSQHAANRADLFVVQSELWAGIVIQLLSLAAMYALSVFKPWGKRVAA
jgi:hypothetical protein